MRARGQQITHLASQKLSNPGQASPAKITCCLPVFVSNCSHFKVCRAANGRQLPLSEGAATWTGLPSSSCCKTCTAMQSPICLEVSQAMEHKRNVSECLITCVDNLSIDLLIVVDLLATLVICPPHGLSHCKGYIILGTVGICTYALHHPCIAPRHNRKSQGSPPGPPSAKIEL